MVKRLAKKVSARAHALTHTFFAYFYHSSPDR
jgi:hypothetical protein